MKVRYLKKFVAGLPNENILKELSKDPKALEFVHDPRLSCNECVEDSTKKTEYDTPEEFLLKHVVESLKFPLNLNNAFSGVILPEGTDYSYKKSTGDYKYFKTLIDNHFDLLTNNKGEVEALIQLVNNTGSYIGVGKFKALKLLKNVLSEPSGEWKKILGDKNDWKTKMEEFVKKCEEIEPLREKLCHDLKIDKINLKNLKNAIQGHPKVVSGIIKSYRNKNVFSKMEMKEFFEDEKILGLVSK